MLQDLFHHPHLPISLFCLLVDPLSNLNRRRQIAWQRRILQSGLQLYLMQPISSGPGGQMLLCCQVVSFGLVALVVRQDEVVAEIGGIP